MPEENTVPEGLTIAEDGKLTEHQKNFMDKGWRLMSPEYGTHPSTESHSGLDSFIKSYVHKEKALGGKKLPMPRKDWKSEDWQEFNEQIGTPKEAKDYGLEAHEGINEADMDWYKEMAHKNGLSDRQAKSLWNDMYERNTNARKTLTTKQAQEKETKISKLKDKWGSDFEAMLTSTNKGFKKWDTDGSVMKVLKDRGLMDEPDIIELAHKIASSFNEDNAPGGTKTPRPVTKEQGAAKAKKLMSEAIKNKKDSALFNKNDPMHEEAVAEYTKYAGMGGS